MSQHSPAFSRHITASVTLVLAISLAGCGTETPDSSGFPWQERPTSAPTLVPVPTPDGENTTSPDPEGNGDRRSVDLIAEALAEQSIALQGVYNADDAPDIEEGVHYTELAVIPELFRVEPDSGRRESQRVIDGSLTPEGSVDVIFAQLERDGVGDADAGREAIEEAHYWRQNLDGTREAFEPLWRSGHYPGEYPLHECPHHVLTTRALEAPGSWRLTVWPTDPDDGDVRSFDFEADDEAAVSDVGLFPTHIECDSEFAVIVSEAIYWSVSQAGQSEAFGPGQPAVIFLSEPQEPHPLAAVSLTTTRAGEILVAQVAPDTGEVWNLRASGDDAPLLSLPGAEHVEWLHIAASDDHLVVALRDTTPIRSSTATRAYVVLVDLTSSQATVYTRTVAASPNEVPTAASIGDDILAINFVSPSLTSGMLAIDLSSDIIVRVGGSVSYGYSGYTATSGDLIGFRRLTSERQDTGHVTTTGTEYVIGRWIREP